MTYLDDKKVAEVDALVGACMLVRREVMDRVGLMDEDYFMYGEDLDWCYRIKKQGWKIYYVPQAEIIHYGGLGGSRHHSFSNRNIVKFYRAMYVFYKKHYAQETIFLLNWLIYTGISMKAIIDLGKNLLVKEKVVGTRKPGT